MTTLNRRELLQQVAHLMGGIVSMPAMLAVLNGCSAKPGATWKPEFLTQAQADTVAEVAEVMIPRTDTPGAKDLGIPAFIDRILKDAYASEDQARFVTGCNEFDALAQAEHKGAFTSLGLSERAALVQRVHDDAIVAERARPRSARIERPFILMTKELALLGYFTSEVGAKKVLQYDPVPGAYHGCVPLTQAGNGKNWATDASNLF